MLCNTPPIGLRRKGWMESEQDDMYRQCYKKHVTVIKALEM